MLYFAYGSNTNHAQMRRRCPSAKFVRKLALPNWRLDFRVVADLTPDTGGSVDGALWRLSDADLIELDKYEGVATGKYFRDHFRVINKKTGKKSNVVVYLMSTMRELAPPSQLYFQTIQDGFKDCGMGTQPLDAALLRCYNERPPARTHVSSLLKGDYLSSYGK